MEGPVAKKKTLAAGRHGAAGAQSSKTKRWTRVRATDSLPAPPRSAYARFQALVDDQKRLDAAIAKDRTKRMASYAKALEKFKKAKRVDSALTVRVLAEGDSWFNYPVPGKTDTIQALQAHIATPISNMAHFGEEVRQMLGLKLRREIEHRLSRKAPDGQPWDVMLFSGGGNDFVGDPLCLWLNTFAKNMPPAGVINPERFDAVLEIVRAGYQDLIDIRDRVSPKTVLFFHQYDFAKPTGVGVCHVGPWLQPGLNYRGVPADMQSEVIRLMLKQFAGILSRLTSPIPNSLVVVQTQNTFPDQSDKWWANELHPTVLGFKAIAEKFHAALRTRFPHLL